VNDDGEPAGTGLEELMERYVDGDPAAFDQLYLSVSPKLLGYLLRLTRHRERAEDLLQTTFARYSRLT
jgi:RNA polymerase sigma-70 factor (ECF subfamily)